MTLFNLWVQVEPKGTKEALVIWDLIDKSRKWDYGVDISYRLKSLGGCSEQLTGAQEPINVLNVQEKEHMLTDLKPGSTYEVGQKMFLAVSILTLDCEEAKKSRLRALS